MSSEHHKRMEARNQAAARERMAKRNKELAEERAKVERKLAKQRKIEAVRRAKEEARRQEEARKMEAKRKAKEETHRREEVRKIEAERRAKEEVRKRAEAIETAKMAKLRSQIPVFEREVASINQSLEKTEKRMSALSKRVDNVNIKEMHQKIVQLNQEQTRIQARLSQVNNNQENLSSNIETLSQALKLNQKEVGNLIADWNKTLGEVKVNANLSQQNLQEINSIDSELSQFFDKVNKAQAIIADGEQATFEYSKDLQELEKSYNLIVAEINLLSNLPAVSIPAFLEMESLRENGYELKGIISGEEIDLWFEDQKNEKRVALKIKSLVEARGIQWLKELDFSGFNESEEETLVEDHMEALGEMGVEYEIGNNRKPRNPPPGSVEQWKKMVETERKAKSVKPKNGGFKVNSGRSNFNKNAQKQ